MSQHNDPIILDHIVDRYRCYPGEVVTFQTRVKAVRAVSTLTVQLDLPHNIYVDPFPAEPLNGQSPPEMIYRNGSYRVIWQVAAPLNRDEVWEQHLPVTIGRTSEQRAVASRAEAVLRTKDGETISIEEWVTVAVSPKSTYLSYLPALYEDDELMGRFLMIFESFWQPIDGQIEALPLYIDPKLTPAEFLPWLASWMNLVLDERWPEARRRKLLQQAAQLFRQRGTKEGLRQHLKTYTGLPVKIIEHRADNLQLGSAKFGPGIALGKDNRPHTFTVIVQLPADVESDAQIAEQQRVIKTIIDAEKPAHTTYTLQIEHMDG